MPQECEICEKPIEGKPFSLSDLSDHPRVLKVCETCAGSDWVTVIHDGIDVTVYRDDYLRADKERFGYAVESAFNKASDCGWDIDELTFSARSDQVKKPLDNEC